jgi:hypothetical protein
MTDPIGNLIGDYRAFTTLQRDRLAARGIDIASYELSHLAFRTRPRHRPQSCRSWWSVRWPQ